MSNLNKSFLVAVSRKILTEHTNMFCAQYEDILVLKFVVHAVYAVPKFLTG
jgi:hypothetical protein